MISERTQPQSSYHRTRRRFDTAYAAANYAQRQRRDRRERRCILAALESIPRGATILDVPCGTGRLTEMLVQLGVSVVGADSSAHMVERARQLWRASCRGSSVPESRARFEVRDILDSGFGDREFDAVICNRLFHHFPEAEIRQAGLAELRRICKGPVIVSFFNRFALDSIRLWFLRVFRHRFTRDRIPISLGTFVADARSVGLRLDRAIPTRWGISPQWYAVFRAEK